MLTKSRVSALLGIRYPILQASMVWITSAELVAAVSNAGGLGVLGPNAGKKTVTGDPAQTAEVLRREIRRTRQLTDRPFAVNYLLPIEGLELSTRYADTIFDVLREEKIDIVITSGEDLTKSQKTIERLKEADSIVIHRDLSPTVEKAIHAERLGVDALIVTGHEAGGHLSAHRISTLSLVPQVAEVLSIPVIAAGGIYNSKGVKAAFALGAEGVYMGTRFINTVENPASETVKQAIARLRSEDLIEVSTPVGVMKIIAEGTVLNDMRDKIDVNEIGRRYINGFKVGMLDGDTENGIVSVSEAAGGINDILTCKEVIDEIAAAF